MASRMVSGDRNQRLSFRPLVAGDLPTLYDWLCRPHVAEWWDGVTTYADVQNDFLPYLDADSLVRAYIVLLEGVPIGFIQSYVVMGSGGGWWEQETDPGARGIDQFLANGEQLGQGLGSAMIRKFVDGLFADPAVTKVQTDPSPENERAIRCYRRAGFKAIGEVVTPDGPALFMICTRAEHGGAGSER